MSGLDLPVEEFTTPDPVTANADMKINEIYQKMMDNGIRHIPVVDGKKAIGIISDRDIRLILGLGFAETGMILASDIMIPDPVTVNSATALVDVAFEMSEKKIGSVIVNDDNDELMGIFTVTDALNALIELARMKAND